MDRSISLSRNLINFGMPVALLAVLILLMKSPDLIGNNIMDLAISIDLLLTVPIVYFILIYKTKIPKTTVIPMMIAGLLLGSYFLPKESQTYLDLFKTWALPVIEVSILALVVIKVRTAIKKYKNIKGATLDFFAALKSTCYEILPKKLALAFATEIAVFYYGFINWSSRTLQENEFSYHKNTGTLGLFGAFILVIAIETIALHFFLARWTVIGAWIMTGLSAYTAIQLLGIAKSLTKRPISINQDSLSLKYGILNEVEIPLTDIEKIDVSSKSVDTDLKTANLSPVGENEGHNMVFYLKKENELVGLYGIRKRFKIIKLHIDQPQEFKVAVQNALPQQEE